MFCNCSTLTSLNLSNFNTNNVNHMSYMFYNSSSLIFDLSNFNTNNNLVFFSMLKKANKMFILINYDSFLNTLMKKINKYIFL